MRVCEILLKILKKKFRQSIIMQSGEPHWNGAAQQYAAMPMDIHMPTPLSYYR